MDWGPGWAKGDGELYKGSFACHLLSVGSRKEGTISRYISSGKHECSIID